MFTLHHDLLFTCPITNGFQSTLLAPKYDENKGIYVKNVCKNFESRNHPAAQIHYNGHNHWVMSFLHDKNGPVYVLDSICKGYLTTSLQMQLSMIYGHGKEEIDVVMPLINQQRNSKDCGLFAIANITEFCFTNFKGIDSGRSTCIYEQELMRKHLLECLETQKMAPFPKRNRKRGTSFLSYDIKIKMNCPCGLPDCIQDLVQCHSCDTWYHMYHTTRSLKGDWECDNCFLAESL